MSNFTRVHDEIMVDLYFWCLKRSTRLLNFFVRRLASRLDFKLDTPPPDLNNKEDLQFPRLTMTKQAARLGKFCIDVSEEISAKFSNMELPQIERDAINSSILRTNVSEEDDGTFTGECWAAGFKTPEEADAAAEMIAAVVVRYICKRGLER